MSIGDDEALIVIDLGGKKSYVWTITRSAADWSELYLYLKLPFGAPEAVLA